MMSLTEKPRLDLLIPSAAKQTKIEEESNKSYYPRVSNSGSCGKALTYAARGIAGKDHSGRMAVLFEDGHIHEEATIKWLSKTPYNVTEQQLGLNIAEIPNAPEGTRFCSDCQEEIPLKTLHGHIDGLIHTESNTFLFEHKGLGDYSFQKLSNEFPTGYITQCCAYLVGLKNMGMEISDALLVIKNKNNSEYRQVHIHYEHDTDIARAMNEWNGVVEYFHDVVKKLIDLHVLVEDHRSFDSNLPDRPYDYDDWHCKVCRYNEICWMDYPLEIKNRTEGEVLSDDDELAFALSRLHEARELKAEAKALEDEARADANRIMRERGVKTGTFGNYRFSVSAFNAKSVDDSLIPPDILEAATRNVLRTSIRVTEMK